MRKSIITVVSSVLQFTTSQLWCTFVLTSLSGQVVPASLCPVCLPSVVKQCSRLARTYLSPTQCLDKYIGCVKLFWKSRQIKPAYQPQCVFYCFDNAQIVNQFDHAKWHSFGFKPSPHTQTSTMAPNACHYIYI